jgi:Contractile injection system tube protein
MERVAFLVEETNQRIGCLLNPNTLVLRRAAGVRTRLSASGQLTGAGQSDDPLLYTGGGKTELELELLFDVSLAGQVITGEDVRELTRPLWELSENRPEYPSRGAYRQPPVVRFIWGKYWNIPGVVTAVAERLEHFTPAGAPRRSWMRLRLVRITEPGPGAQELPHDVLLSPEDLAAAVDTEALALEGEVVYHEVMGGGAEVGGETGGVFERLDEIATRYFGNPSFWRWIALVNNIDDPLHLRSGMTLRIIPFRRSRTE